MIFKSTVAIPSPSVVDLNRPKGENEKKNMEGFLIGAMRVPVKDD